MYHRKLLSLWGPCAIVAAFALFSPSTSSTAVGKAAARAPITQQSTGKTFRLAKGTTATLRLGNRWRWSTPRRSTKAVDLVPVEYLVDPGFREWTIEAHARGRATIRSFGTPTCSGCALPARRFLVTIVVGAG